MFSSWTRQSGFPMLTVNRNYETGAITISQERYLNNRFSNMTNSTSWWIPYNFTTAKSLSFSDTKPLGWLAQDQPSKLIEASGDKSWATPSEWVLFNKQQTGYYRVMYDTRNWKLLIAELNAGNHSRIPPISRSQLLDDLRNFVASGRLPANLLIEMVKYLKYETEYAPWVAGSRALLYMKENLATAGEYEVFRRMAASIIKSATRRFFSSTMQDESLSSVGTSDILTNLSCEFGVGATVYN